jgi:hypothetical protein
MPPELTDTEQRSLTSKRRDVACLAIVCAAFVATRVYLLFFFQPLYTDLVGYFEYAINGVDFRQTPYRDNPTDRPLEYPPLAYWTMAVPRWLAATPLYRADAIQGRHWEALPDYVAIFRREMFAFDLGAFVLFLLIVRRRRPALLLPAGLGYIAVTTLLGHVVYDRLDIGVLFFLLAWAYAWLRSDETNRWSIAWQIASHVALGMGIAYKLLPIVVVPLVIIGDLRAIRSARDAARQAATLLLLAATATGPFLFYLLRDGTYVFGVFRYHSERGIQIESVYASLILLLKPLGLAVQVTTGYGSSNLESSVSGALVTTSSVLLIALLGSVALWACRSNTKTDRATIYGVACCMLVASLALAKVISVQYLVWALPVLLLAATESLSTRQLWGLVAVCVIMAGLSTWVFPYLWRSEYPSGNVFVPNAHPLVPDLNWLPCSALAVRNLLLVVSVIWVGGRLAGHFSVDPRSRIGDAV